MFAAVAKKWFGTANERFVKSLAPKVAAINALEPKMQALTTEQLRDKTDEFRMRLAQGMSLDDMLPEAFAVVREMSVRVLNMRHFDVQMVGGMVLHQGKISEMKTGEGKTLVSTLPAYLNALTGKGVHVVTVNDYLAQRDAQWMGKLFEALGLTVGCIVHGLSDEERQAAYGCDITYATNNELGFDYLRDNMKFRLDRMVHRAFNYAIVDEVDSILIDEARTPLIISGPTEDNSELYQKINLLIPQLVAADYEKDEKTRSVTLTEGGVRHVEQLLERMGLITPPASLYDMENISLVHHVDQALRAHHLFARDVDYIVKDKKVIIIDEFTGRMMEGRRYSDGLHQALEARENVPIQNENQTLASITFQNYFRLYPKLSGMTGTAMTEANEFADIYKLEVIEIPTHVPVMRLDHDDEIYRTADEKYRAVIMQIGECVRRNQPVLVGTASIEKSEYLSTMLRNPKLFREIGKDYQKQADALHEEWQKRGKKPDSNEAEKQIKLLQEKSEFFQTLATKPTPIAHQVLNARYHEQEAQIIAQAGRPGAVTIATNMAGRGTDIMLGGNAQMLIRQQIGEAIEPGSPQEAQAQQILEEVARAKQQVLEAGGLYVLATERHESRRIDNQLRGRSGRQGDPGASKFFLSLQDDLMRIFGGQRVDGMLQKLGLKEGEAIFHPWMTRTIERAQQKVEARNYEIRKNLLRFDDVMNDQRKVIYEQRIELIHAQDASEAIASMRDEVVDHLVGAHIPPKAYSEQWDLDGLEREVFRLFGLHLPIKSWAQEESSADEEVLAKLRAALDDLQREKEARYGEKMMRFAEKRILLQTLDQLWKDHLLSLDHLRSGINLRAYGQRDPLNEYKQEAFALFEQMLSQMRELVVARLAHLEISVEPTAMTMPGDLFSQSSHRRLQETRVDPAQQYGDDDVAGLAQIPSQPVQHQEKVGRNEPCPCGSGRKFKHCHGIISGA